MPAYDYRCPSCDHLFEVVRAITDRTEVTCPTCETTAKRIFTPTGIVFKGSGFHNTDYRPRPKSEESPSSEKDSSAKSTNSDVSSTAPAATPPTPSSD